MSSSLAGTAVPAENSVTPHQPEIVPERDKVREMAARLYAQGLKRPAVARMMLNYLTPHSRHVNTGDVEKRVIVAKVKLRRWEQEQEFRDMVWNLAVVQTDLATPRIMDGMVRRAEKGNVLAARLALEVTGRHNPKGEAAPTQIAIVVGSGIQRPHVVNGQQAVVEGTARALPEAVIAQAGEDEDDEA